MLQLQGQAFGFIEFQELGELAYLYVVSAVVDDHLGSFGTVIGDW
jgi:hypothetical protein